MFVVHGAALVAPYGGMSVGVAVVLLPSPLAGEGLGMRGEVSHMFAVHGAALVAPYGCCVRGDELVRFAVVCPLLPLREKGWG